MSLETIGQYFKQTLVLMGSAHADANFVGEWGFGEITNQNAVAPQVITYLYGINGRLYQQEVGVAGVYRTVQALERLCQLVAIMVELGNDGLHGGEVLDCHSGCPLCHHIDGVRLSDFAQLRGQ
jgi:hypothetical protein